MLTRGEDVFKYFECTRIYYQVNHTKKIFVHSTICIFIKYIQICLYVTFLRLIESYRGAMAQVVTVNTTGYVFHSHSRKLSILYFYYLALVLR